MADEEQDEAVDPAAKPDTGGSGSYLLMVILVLLLEAAAGYYFLDRAFPAPEEAPKEEQEELQVKEEWKPPVYYEELEEIVFSPSDSRGDLLVQMSLALEVDSKAASDELTIKHTIFWDMVLSQLEQVSADDVRDPQKTRIKNAVMEALNPKLRNGEVLGVYVTDYVIQ